MLDIPTNISLHKYAQDSFIYLWFMDYLLIPKIILLEKRQQLFLLKSDLGSMRGGGGGIQIQNLKI